MNDKLVSHVEELGLSNKEARVYLACLALGAAPVQKIADESGIKRVTTYVILESLAGLGLVSQSSRGKKTFFVAEDPINLERLLEKREEELSDQKQNFAHILPDLKSLKAQPKDSPSVKFYDSANGIKTIQTNFFEQATKPGVGWVYGFTNLDLLLDYFPEFMKDMSNPWRRKAGIRSQLLYTSKEGAVMKETDNMRNRESRWLPPEKYPIVGDFTIVGDNILMLSLGAPNPTGITINSRELSEGLRVIFRAAWEEAAQYN